MSTNTWRIVAPRGDTSEQSTETWLVEVAGRRYTFERWFTRGSGGEEWYEEDGVTPTEDPFEDNDDARAEFYGGIDTVTDRYWTLYRERIEPHIAALIAEVYGEEA